jgi:glyoxylase-like metal-dependent hydrolase (beta-lactamase superfamily II)
MQINKHVHALRIPFSVINHLGIGTDRFVYVYLISGDEVCLIDTGVASSEELIFDYVRSIGREVSDISRIILTHSHPAHMGATRAIKMETGCSVAVHSAEKAWVENVELQFKERPLPGFDTLVSGPVAIDRTLEDGDVIGLACGLKLQVLHTPGHSKGSLSLFLPGYNILFSGDAVPVPGEVPVYEDVPALVNSIKRLKEIKGIRHFLPSWDEPRKGDQAYERMDEGLRYIQRIHEAVLKAADDDPSPEPMRLCEKVLGELGLPSFAAGPLVARIFAAHLLMRGHRILI